MNETIINNIFKVKNSDLDIDPHIEFEKNSPKSNLINVELKTISDNFKEDKIFS